jgi:hypothetical protein
MATVIIEFPDTATATAFVDAFDKARGVCPSIVAIDVQSDHEYVVAERIASRRGGTVREVVS